MWQELIDNYRTIKDFQRISNDGTELTKINMDGVVGITVENGSDSYLLYLENEQSKTYNVPINVDDSRTLVSPLGCPFQGDMWCHFANESNVAQSGTVIIILFKVIKIK